MSRALTESELERIADKVVQKLKESVRSGELGLVAGKDATCQDQETRNQESVSSPTTTRPATSGELLNAKEMARSDGHLAVVVRPDRSGLGGYLVAVVVLATGRAPFGTNRGVPKSEVGRTVASDLRMLHKCGHSESDMADASRHRR